MHSVDVKTRLFIQAQEPQAQKLIRRLDGVLMHVCPAYVSGRAWAGIAYKIGKNYSCMVCPYKDHVKLMIWLGKKLDDPKKILQGAGSNTQHLRYDTVGDIDPVYLKSLLTQQFALFDRGVRFEAKAVKRKVARMPGDISDALKARGLLDSYKSRPSYQQRDYVQWISYAKQPVTRQKRVDKMLAELKVGDKYMNMKYTRKRYTHEK